MGFITIKKGVNAASVSESMYESFFKKAGWRKIGVKQKKNTSEWDSVDDDLSEKPISELTPDEVKQLAASKGVKTDGKNTRQLREEIKKLL